MPYNSKTITFIIISTMLKNILAGVVYMETLLTTNQLALVILIISTIEMGIATWIRFNTDTALKFK